VLPAVRAHAIAPVPPCAGPPSPAYAALGTSPHFAVFHSDDLTDNWPLAACAGLPVQRPALLIATAGRFAGPPDSDALLTHIGAISSRIGTRYWSITDRRWEKLVTDAYALRAPDLRARAPDFTALEMKSGRELYFAQKDNRSSSPVIYRLHVRDLAPSGFVLEEENVTPIRFLLVTIYGTGAIRSVSFLHKDANNTWDYYALTDILAEPPLFGSSERSAINRAAAQFRSIAGLPTDQDPPAAP
jgi:hypothetical protein